ncbi:MAG TPA: HEAT repeat domain-containing protein [Spirochaetia bacterium]|nr:HEAT repeat domain-containing protein [Spirochaetia bacterium]
MKSFPAFGILFGSRARLSELRAFLEKSSGLPGPRANLELGASFAEAVSRMKLQEWQWDFLVQVGSTSPHKAPENTPKVYAVFCALLALGALYGQGLPRPRRREALAVIRRAAADERWRVREASAMALQKVGEADAAELIGIVSGWMTDASWLEMRAIAAALAHPPILTGDVAAFSLEVSGRILAAMSRADAAERRRDEFRVLRQGMGYALSVFAAAAPAEGFALLRKTAAVSDRDLAWIVRENLKKKRLAAASPDEVAAVAAVLDETGAK